MTPKELAAQCHKAIAVKKQYGFSEPARVTLVYPKGSKVIRKGFPRGQLLCVNSDGGRVYLYEAHKILKVIDKLIEVDG